MNAELMIDTVLDIVDDPSFDREEDVLKYLNLAQVATAGAVLLPGLSDGYSTVDTLVDAYKVPVPTDYHHTVIGAQVDNAPVTVSRNFGDIFNRFGRLSLEAGPVSYVCIHNRNVVYQKVPAVSKQIELFYYRVPTKMTDSPTSYPDGLNNDGLHDVFNDYAQILVHFAAWKLFALVEDGMEGDKVNTTYHAGMYSSLLADFDVGPQSKTKIHPPPPVCEVNW